MSSVAGGGGERVPEGSGKQFGEDVADLEEVDERSEPVREGSGKQFAEDVADVEEDQPGGIPAGSGKQFAPGHEGDTRQEPPEAGQGFARGQSPEADA